MSRSEIILVIDENSDQQLIIGYSLRKNIAQAEPVFSTTTEETLLYLYHCAEGRLACPILVLLTIQVAHQERDWQLLKELRARYPLLPVVVLSADHDSDFVRQTYELGAHSFIAKPYDVEAWERLCKRLRTYWFGVVTLPLAY